MEPMEKRNIFVWVGGGVAAAILVIIFAFSGANYYQPNNSTKINEVPVPSDVAPKAVETNFGKGTQLAPGASAITETGKVVAPSGNEARTDSGAMAEDLPTQSVAIPSSAAPAGAIKLVFSNGVFSPQTFRAAEGDTVVLAITSDQNEIFRFDESALRGIVMDVRAGETRLIPFTVSVPTGSYNLRAQIKNVLAVMEVD
jgi:hypothetical protein